LTSSERIASLKLRAASLPHGVRARYSVGCRCRDCRRANCEYEKERNYKRQTGDWNGRVDATRAREHLKALSRQGVGRHAVEDVTGIACTILYGIISGDRKRVSARNERKILAVDLQCSKDGAYIDARPTWLLLDRLFDSGYTKTQLAAWLGSKAKVPSLQLKRGARITAIKASKIERLYRLIDTGKIWNLARFPDELAAAIAMNATLKRQIRRKERPEA
jgi:hypothetical protein